MGNLCSFSPLFPLHIPQQAESPGWMNEWRRIMATTSTHPESSLGLYPTPATYCSITQGHGVRLAPVSKSYIADWVSPWNVISIEPSTGQMLRKWQLLWPSPELGHASISQSVSCWGSSIRKAQAPKNSLPMESHRTRFSPPEWVVITPLKCRSQQLRRDPVPRDFPGFWSCRHSLSSIYQNSHNESRHLA